MNQKVEDELQVRLESDERLPDQFDVILRIINRIIAARRADETQQYQSTHVELKTEDKSKQGTLHFPIPLYGNTD